jgi:hypothetical protein
MDINELRLRLVTFSDKHRLNPKLLEAILNNESNCQGFKGNVIKNRFEPAVFNKMYNNAKAGKFLFFPEKYCPPMNKLKDFISVCSTSWGISQVMGYYFHLIGYDNPHTMIASWVNSEMKQVEDWFVFLENYHNGRFLKALKSGDLQLISKMYNGAGYKANKYDTKLLNYITK